MVGGILMKTIYASHYQKSIKDLCRKLIDMNTPITIITEHVSYIEDICLKETDVLFNIEIMKMSNFCRELLVSHQVFDRRLLSKPEWVYLIRQILIDHDQELNYFHYTKNPYALIDEIIESLKLVHDHHLSLDPHTNDLLTIKKCEDLKLIDDELMKRKDPHTYINLIEETIDLTDTNRLIVVLKDDYPELGYEYYFNQFNNVIFFVAGEDGKEYDSYEDFIIHGLFSTDQRSVDQTCYKLVGGHPLQECMKIASDIKRKITDEEASYHDFMIVTNEDVYDAYFKYIFDEWNYPHSLTETSSFYYDSDYRIVNQALSTAEGNNFSEIVSSLLPLVKGKDMVDYLKSLDYTDHITPEEFKEFLKVTLPDQKISHDKHDEIRIVHVEDALCDIPSHIYVCGINEGHFPTVFKDSELLLDEDLRSISKDVPDTITKLRDHEKMIQRIFLNPILTLTLSYSVNDMGGNALLPSSLYLRLEKVLEPINLKPDLRLFDTQLYLKGSKRPDHPMNTLLSDTPNSVEVIDEAYRDALGKGMSISRLETYNKCPFQYFMKYGMKIYPPKTDELQANELGSLAHHLMEMCLDEPDKIYEESERYFEDDPDLKKKMEAAAINTLMVHDVIDNTKEAILINRYHLNSGDYSVFGKEYEVKDEIVSAPILGIIDRVDRYNDIVRIIDYKSSDKDVDLDLAVQGFNIQMLVYLQMLVKELKTEPGGVFYFNLSRRKLTKNTDLSKQIDEVAYLKEYALKGYAIADESFASINAAGDSATVMNVGFTRDGALRKNAHVISIDKYQKVMEMVDQKINSIYEAIHEGHIEILPTTLEGRDNDPRVYPCAYCDYRSVCQFDAFYNETRIIKNKVLEGDEENA